MKLIPIGDINVGSRQRKEFSQKRINDLTESIASVGLLHPVVVTKDSDQSLRLVAGERRYRAMCALHKAKREFVCNGASVPRDSIPSIFLETSSELELREAELAENLERVDLSWQEKTVALDELHKLRTAQNPKQTETDTAKEIAPRLAITESHAQTKVHQARIVAASLDNPTIAGAKTEKQAYDLLMKEAERDLRAALSRSTQAKAPEKRTLHKLIIGNCLEQLPLLTDATFDCIIADPPYGINANAFGDAANLSHQYEDDENTAIKVADEIFVEGMRVTKKNAHLWMFCDIELFFTLRATADVVGWKVWRTPVIWYKTSPQAHAPAHEKGFRRNYELLLFAVKGAKPFQQVYRDVIECGQEQDKDHAAQKPVDLYDTILSRSCIPGDSVLDPCCGSGTIFPAATRQGVKATGIELDPEMAKWAEARMYKEAD